MQDSTYLVVTVLGQPFPDRPCQPMQVESWHAMLCVRPTTHDTMIHTVVSCPQTEAAYNLSMKLATKQSTCDCRRKEIVKVTLRSLFPVNTLNTSRIYFARVLCELSNSPSGDAEGEKEYSAPVNVFGHPCTYILPKLWLRRCQVSRAGPKCLDTTPENQTTVWDEQRGQTTRQRSLSEFSDRCRRVRRPATTAGAGELARLN